MINYFLVLTILLVFIVGDSINQTQKTIPRSVQNTGGMLKMQTFVYVKSVEAYFTPVIVGENCVTNVVIMRSMKSAKFNPNFSPLKKLPQKIKFLNRPKVGFFGVSDGKKEKPYYYGNDIYTLPSFSESAKGRFS